MICPARDGDLEQPLGHALTRAAELREAAQQPGNVRNITQLVGERRSERLVFQFHVSKLGFKSGNSQIRLKLPQDDSPIFQGGSFD